MSRTIVWFRGKDLRITDHAPLSRAIDDGGEIIPLFVVDPYFFAPERAKKLPHRIQFLLDSLSALERNIASRGSRLIVVRGKSIDVVPRLADAWRADRVVAHRWIEPFARERDRRIGEALGDRWVLYEGETLHPPGTIRTGGGKPYSVFTPFSRSFAEVVSVGAPLAAPEAIPAVPDDVSCDGIDGVEPCDVPTMETLELTRNEAIQAGGERAARKRLGRFLDDGVTEYPDERDRMDHEGTSRLSADLKFGTLSPRQVWHAVSRACGEHKGAKAYLRQLIWREFAHTTLWDRPELLKEPFRSEFENFPWRMDDESWTAWVDGKTGYPVVDASARQLLGEGFVHNRARMISASFLTKHLLIGYQSGEAHYMKWLTDGDWAQNNLGWQWSAGCGCDAQPYFRVFNPMSQGEKFDPDGEYVRKWVPELAKLPKKWIHRPWEAPQDVLREAGVTLGETYPEPIVDHKEARTRFLDLASGYLKGR